MRKHSANYNPFTPTRTLDIDISFGLINEKAKDIAVANASDTSNRTSAAELLNRNYSAPRNWATFEKSGWILGAEQPILPTDSSALELGWWSDVASDENGTFATPPYVMFAFSEPMTTYGWSLFFDEKNKIHATEVRITAYAEDGETVLTSMLCFNDKAALYVSNIVEDYSYVKIEFLSVNEPFRKVRLSEVDFGLTQHFGRDTLVKAAIIEDADIIARTLPARQLTFTFDNSGKIYNMLKPDMLYNYFSSGSKISVTMNVNDDTIDMGSFFFTAAETQSNALTAQITANDVIIQLDKMFYSHDVNEEMTLEEAVNVILEGVDIERQYDEGLASVRVNLSTASYVSRREMLRMLAQAAMCTCYVNRDNKLVFTNLVTREANVSSIDKHALYNFNGLAVDDYIDKVTLLCNDPLMYGGTRQYEAGEGTHPVEVNNPCVAEENGAAVAAWLLEGYKRRVRYKVKNRCDPAVEIGDTVRLDDTYGENLNAVVNGVDIRWSGGMYATTRAVR